MKGLGHSVIPERVGARSWARHTPVRCLRALDTHSIEIALRRALEREEFALCYQPTIDLKTGLISGAEALLRWHHPIWGLIAPSRFISIAEQSQLIVPIGEWVLGEACRQAALFAAVGGWSGTMSVNVSSVQLRQHDFVRRVCGILGETGTNPARLQLELTESVLMANTGASATALQGLRSMGVQIALDDFGTGYSSLSYLEKFTVDCLKIDQSFIRQISEVGVKKTLVTAIITIGHTLGLRVVAEGVETEEQFNFVTQSGCDEGQGFYFSRPLSAQVFAQRLSIATPAPE